MFFPSGTMAQQIALRIWSDTKAIKKVAYHPLCHLEIHEKDGLKVLHHLEPILLGSKDRLFNMEDLMSVSDPLACLLIELPQREIGGQLPAWEELVELSFGDSFSLIPQELLDEALNLLDTEFKKYQK